MKHVLALGILIALSVPAIAGPYESNCGWEDRGKNVYVCRSKIDMGDSVTYTACATTNLESKCWTDTEKKPGPTPKPTVDNRILPDGSVVRVMRGGPSR